MLKVVNTTGKSLVSPWVRLTLHGVLLHHSMVVRVAHHVPVVVHLGQVDRLAGHVKVVEILEREMEGGDTRPWTELTTRSVNLSCPLMCA